jgi:hypothetical protein
MAKCYRFKYCPGKIPKRNRQFHCPKNTDCKCNVIPKLKKAIKVKVWVVADMDGINARWEPEESGWRYAIFKTRKAARVNADGDYGVFPYTIEISVPRPTTGEDKTDKEKKS